MLCQKCKVKNATSHIHYVLNGVVRDMYLCPECAKEYHGTDLYDGDVFKMLSSMLNDSASAVKNTLKCDCCGTDFNEIRRTGKVGCANCYKVFENQLSPTVARIHGKTVHVGKKPCQTEESAANNEAPTVAKMTKEQIIAELKQQLADAISREEYEKAVILRDKIKEEEA